MFKSHVCLELRVLLSSIPAAFSNSAETKGPIPNVEALHSTVLLARALGFTLPPAFPRQKISNPPALPDLASLSFISLLVGTGGTLPIVFHGREKQIRLAEIRLEEHAGRLTHSGKHTHMDYSHLGLPSIRLCTESDFELGEEAEIFLHEFRKLLMYLELVPGYPSESVMRCNAYVALAPYPEQPSVFVKLRNLNSFNFVRKAINTDLARQEKLLSTGKCVEVESRIWNEERNITEAFQKREGDTLTRFEQPPSWTTWQPEAELSSVLNGPGPEYPHVRQLRFIEEFDIPAMQAVYLCDEKSRADYFEVMLANGSDPVLAASWLSGFYDKELRRLSIAFVDSPVQPQDFAGLLGLLHAGTIHSAVTRMALSEALENTISPLAAIKANAWDTCPGKREIKAMVSRVLASNPAEVQRVREGDGRPVRFLTGLIMKESKLPLDPLLVRDVLHEQLSVSLVYVLSMGGAISGRITDDGRMEPGDETVLRDLLKNEENRQVRFDSMQLGQLLSEDIAPADWAALISAIADRLASGTANGIVIAHGTATLAYTAALIYWLFGKTSSPVVFAASSTPPGKGSEAIETMKMAVAVALREKGGVHVVYGSKVYAPLNLKFERPVSGGFCNWNLGSKGFSDLAFGDGLQEPDQYVVTQLLEEALDSMCLVRLFPGLKSDYLVALMDSGVRTLFLEVWGTGTASFRDGIWSLKRAFAIARKRGVRIYCTSQQDVAVDFSGFTSSRALWQEGAIPMGVLTTESAIARFLAASIVADNPDEIDALMDIPSSWIRG
jgi:aspartyl-tRNA(Asn)/glutamyl-tRNA(Gln) amidotransferase subunit B